MIKTNGDRTLGSGFTVGGPFRGFSLPIKQLNIILKEIKIVYAL